MSKSWFEAIPIFSKKSGGKKEFEVREVPRKKKHFPRNDMGASTVSSIDVADDKHGAEEIESQFDRLLDQEANRKRMELMHEDFYTHARGGNSKPLQKDVKGSEKISAVIADNDNTERGEDEILRTIDRVG